MQKGIAKLANPEPCFKYELTGAVLEILKGLLWRIIGLIAAMQS